MQVGCPENVQIALHGGPGDARSRARCWICWRPGRDIGRRPAGSARIPEGSGPALLLSVEKLTQ